jgi:hypothetical protein
MNLRAEVVENRQLVTSLKQLAGKAGTNESSAAGDQYLQFTSNELPPETR